MPDLRLKQSLHRLGLKQVDLARLLGVSARTVSLWATGAAPVPGTVAAYLRVLRLAGAPGLAAELSRLRAQDNALCDGVYGLSFSRGDGQISGQGVAVLREGRIAGSDRGGGVFTGSYAFDPRTTRNAVKLTISAPPSGVLVNGITAGPGGTVFDVSALLDRPQPTSTVIVEAAGLPIEIELSYLGPLPN